jgi:RNA polymerase sigma-70 factor (ECF subfamily)
MNSKNLEQMRGKRNICIYRLMPIIPTDSIDGLSFPRAAIGAFAAGPSETERQVIHLFDDFRDSLLRYVLSFGLSVQDGEEITQEVFLALFRHLQLGKSRQNLRGWIFRVAHNLALKQRCANQRSRDSAASDWTIAERQFDPSPNPEEQASFTQRCRRLLAVVQALPEEDQCCLRLRAEGLRYREIAAVLDLSLGAVSISLTRSLARLMRSDRR